MLFSGAIFVNRGNSKEAQKSLAEAGETMKRQHTSLWIFPEGTRSSQETSNLLPFKKGAFHLAVQAGLPIIPVVCENYWRLYRKGVLESGNLRIRGETLSFGSEYLFIYLFIRKVLPPISTNGMTLDNVGDLAVRTREEMLKVLMEISQSTVSPNQEGFDEDSKLKSMARKEPTPEATESERGTELENPSVPEGVEKHIRHGMEGSESNSVDEQTEEEEGMVLVGRPSE